MGAYCNGGGQFSARPVQMPAAVAALADGERTARSAIALHTSKGYDLAAGESC